MKKILITAGPTREMFDPVRFLSNLSTGEMGYAIAEVARDKGYDVTLITGPTALKPPKKVKTVSIVSTRDLKKACEKQFPKHDVLIMTAAVCDFTAESFHKQKIQRTRTKHLSLKRTPDIVASLAKRKGDRTVIGFCLETKEWLAQAKRKLKRKGLDGIVANYYSSNYSPFGNKRVKVAFIDQKLSVSHVRDKTKKQVAAALLGWIKTNRGKDTKKQFKKSKKRL